METSNTRSSDMPKSLYRYYFSSYTSFRSVAEVMLVLANAPVFQAQMPVE